MEALHRRRDAAHEMRTGTKQIVKAAVDLARLLHGLRREVLAEQMARQTFGWPFLKIRIGQPVLQQRVETLALHRMASARIEIFSAIRQVTHRASSSMLHGPASKPSTSFSRPDAGKKTTRAAPPR